MTDIVEKLLIDRYTPREEFMWRKIAKEAAIEIKRLREERMNFINNKDTYCWRFDIENMPHEGRFEAISAHKVYRCQSDAEWVIVPESNRMFKPYAWRQVAY